MLVSAAAITAVVVGGAAIWQTTQGDDAPAAAPPATWDAVALVGTSTGDITLVDTSGAIVARHDGTGRVSRTYAAGSRLALVHGDAVSLVDLAAGADATPHDVALPDQARQVTRLATARERLLLAAGNRTGGDIRVIDGATGAAYDLAELANLSDPRLFIGRSLRVDAAGTGVAVADATSFQTIVVTGLGPESDGDGTPVVDNFAAQPLALGDGLLATSQVVGGRADVSVHRLGGTPSAPVPTGIPAGGMIVDGRLLAVTTDGAVVAIRVGDRQPRQLATLTLPSDTPVTAMYPAASGTRLVVYADSYVAVLDAAGTILFEHTFPAPLPVATTTTTTTTTTLGSVATTPTSPTRATTATTTATRTATTTTTTATATPIGGATASVPATTAPAGDGVAAERGEPLVPAWEWTCLAVGVGTRDAALIGLSDGVELASLGRVAVTAASADGCVVIGSDGGETVVIGEAGRGELGAARNADLSPDGRYVVRRTATATELVALDDELQPGTPVELSDAVPANAYSVAFVER